MNDGERMASRTPSVAGVEDIIGNYRAFFADLRSRLHDAGIDVTGCAMSSRPMLPMR